MQEETATATDRAKDRKIAVLAASSRVGWTLLIAWIMMRFVVRSWFVNDQIEESTAWALDGGIFAAALVVLISSAVTLVRQLRT